MRVAVETRQAEELQLVAEVDRLLPAALTRDPKTGEIVPRKITKAWRAKTTSTLVGVVVSEEAGDEIWCTPGHEFIGPAGSSPAYALAGKYVYRINHESGRQGALFSDGQPPAPHLAIVDEWEVLCALAKAGGEPAAVYDIEVEDTHTYYVAATEPGPAVLVHNSSYKLTIPQRFQPLTELDYEWRDVVVDFGTGETRQCRVPKQWSDNAAATMMSKYAVRTGVPDELGGVAGREVDAKRIFMRLVTGWSKAAVEHGYFDEASVDLRAFEFELLAMLERQIAAPNSPQWFNTGVSAVYGIKAGSDGHYFATVDEHGTATAHSCDDSLEHPQISACFIQSVDDNLVGEGGIMSLWAREARLFKYGSGSGANYSRLRGAGEPLSRGGLSSGLLSFSEGWATARQVPSKAEARRVGVPAWLPSTSTTPTSRTSSGGRSARTRKSEHSTAPGSATRRISRTRRRRP